MDMNSLYITIGIIAGTLFILEVVTKAFRRLLRRVKHMTSRSTVVYEIPGRSILIMTKPRRHYMRWNMGSVGGSKAMQVDGTFTVTNITKYSIRLLKAKIRKPATEGQALAKDADSRLFGDFPIGPGSTTDVSCNFWVQPPVKKKGGTFVADIALVDQFNNEHWIKGVRFESTQTASEAE